VATCLLDLFRIGIGPSSSHTVGPMRAAGRFLDELRAGGALPQVCRVRIDLHGSLAATCRGHSTDLACLLGLLGERPELVDPRSTIGTVQRVRASRRLALAGQHEIDFLESRDLVLHLDPLPEHPNGVVFTALDAAGGEILSATYYSIGGGFVVAATEFDRPAPARPSERSLAVVPHPFRTGDDLLARCDETGLSIARLALENESVHHGEAEVRARLLRVWEVMQECVQAGLNTEGRLPGGLRVLRRAPELARRLPVHGRPDDPLRGLDHISLFALAVSEENAAGGRVVTAPTNGAAGIIPAVLHYYTRFVPGADDEGVIRFLLTAGAIGRIYKQTASISGAEVGCQGEVGSACSMAAAGFAEILGGTPMQVENAAEIAMEHNLGLTCDPVAGLVQIPCIERNAVAAVKAITAARTALYGDGTHLISLDKVVRTMLETGLDMRSKYKETALGGLAVNYTEC
jgi:L-serine dehydratase